MRTMLRWTSPAGPGNASIKNGTLGNILESLMKQLKPEAAYFMAQDGMRGGMMVFDMKDPSEIPVIAEPLFLALEASVEFVPVMNADDLRKGLAKVAG